MGVILRNQDTRSEVQSKVAAELEARLNQTQPIEHKDVDPAFLEKQHQTRGAGVFIVIFLLIALVATVWVVSKL